MVELKKKVDKKKKFIWVKPIILLVMLGLMLLISGASIADGDDHMDGDHMMDRDWWGFPFMWFWMIGVWLVFIVIAFFVYKDAEKRGMNGLLWFVLIILPWVGILFLIIYLIVREDKVKHIPSQRSAGAILDERYARGEITREEYLSMKKDIKS